MKRYATDYLHGWLAGRLRKPLLMRGARQVGKTWLIRDLAKNAEKQLIEINFEKNPELVTAFKSNEPAIILRDIELAQSIKINIDQSILFLDEVQVFPELIAKLRWFYELLPALPVIAAGSLLDFALDDHSFSMPVGRITYLQVEPFSFEEFLMAKKCENLVDYLKIFKLGDEMPQLAHSKLMALFREYLVIGGMPSVIAAFSDVSSLHEIALAHNDLLLNYRDDFSKYAGKVSTLYLEETLRAIPKLLGQKYIYSHVNSDVKAVVLKDALNLLCKARVCYKVHATSANGLPLLSEVDDKRFKVGLIDVGLVSSLLGLRLNQFESVTDINLINQGAISEQVTGQLLRCIEPVYAETNLFYWCREERNANAEIDYIIQHAHHVIPIEVKSGKTGSMKSLQLFMKLKKLTCAVRINSDMPSLVDVDVKLSDQDSVQYQLISIPFYLIEQLHRILSDFFKTH